MLEISRGHTGYGRAEVLHGVTLSFLPGQASAVIGPNGAGKSTLLGSIAGTRSLWSGQVVLEGADITRAPTWQRVALGVSLCPEGRKIIPSMSVEDNIRTGASAGRMSPKAALDQAFDHFEILRERGKQMGGTLSGGQQQMLAIARALASKPKYLLLDEPSLGLAPTVVDQVYAIIHGLKETGIGVVVVEEGVNRALRLAERITVLTGGRVALEGTPHEVAEIPDLESTYFLGGSE